MALYLQMDGVDDYLKTPSVTFDEVVMDIQARQKASVQTYYVDARAGLANSYFMRNGAAGNSDLTPGSGPFAQGLYWDGVKKGNTSEVVPYNKRGILRIVSNVQGTDDINFFSAQNNAACMEADVFDIKLYNGTTLVAHYDMTTGTVQDQSGNGNHATLTGGTWLDDGIGGTGTDGSTSFDLKQSIYSDATVTADTKQVIYEDSATVFDMLQEIFNDGQIGSTHFDMRIQLYADDSTIFDSKQSWYEDGLSRFDLEQAIYEVGQSNQDMRLVIYADSSTKNDTLQTIYSDSYTAFDTKQTMFNADTQLIGTVQLKGSRKLYVYLKGSRVIDIKLKGRVGMTEINQNFSMYSGDSHIIKIPITSDVPLESGATVKWAIKKRNATVDSLLKTTSGGITVENGEIHIKLVPEDTATLAGDYRHECELTDNAGNVSTVFGGLVTVKKSGV